MGTSKDRWLDRDAGPIVRPYALTQGRTRPIGQQPLDLIDIVQAAGTLADAGWPGPGPEHRRILQLCARPVSVADLASEMDLPVGVVRVLLGDLSHHGLITVYRPAPTDALGDERVLRKVLDGLKAL